MELRKLTGKEEEKIKEGGTHWVKRLGIEEKNGG